MQQASLPLCIEVRVGHHAEVIAEYARDQSIDSIVMGTRGPGGVAGLLLGSVANQVLSEVNVPVTLVKYTTAICRLWRARALLVTPVRHTARCRQMPLHQLGNRYNPLPQAICVAATAGAGPGLYSAVRRSL